MCYGGNSHMLVGWGSSAHLSGFWCLSVHPLDVHYASSCTFLVVHYVSSLYFHHYAYYSSNDCGVFWCVIRLMSLLTYVLCFLPVSCRSRTKCTQWVGTVRQTTKGMLCIKYMIIKRTTMETSKKYMQPTVVCKNIYYFLL